MKNRTRTADRTADRARARARARRLLSGRAVAACCTLAVATAAVALLLARLPGGADLGSPAAAVPVPATGPSPGAAQKPSARPGDDGKSGADPGTGPAGRAPRKPAETGGEGPTGTVPEKGEPTGSAPTGEADEPTVPEGGPTGGTDDPEPEPEPTGGPEEDPAAWPTCRIGGAEYRHGDAGYSECMKPRLDIGEPDPRPCTLNGVTYRPDHPLWDECLVGEE